MQLPEQVWLRSRRVSTACISPTYFCSLCRQTVMALGSGNPYLRVLFSQRNPWVQGRPH